MKKLNILGYLWAKWMKTFDSRLRIWGFLCKRCKREVSKEMFARGTLPIAIAHKNTLRVPMYCAGAHLTRSLIAVEPRRPPMHMTNVGTETAFRLDQRKHFWKSKHLLRSEVSWCDQTSIDLHLRRSTCSLLVSRSINMLSVTDFDPKGIISGVRVQAGLYLDMLDADRSPNAVSVHAGTSQVDFEVDLPPACLSTRRSFDHHGKGNGNFV